ncbi:MULTISPECIES: hypothetical protein [Oceanobacillus]|uniref:JAB domain-containing protein n=1 Tax=Oceanobacillus kimchii TaxID=746691 RepID=A0ABQ5TQ67_9BACI|nr:hypothetical protein [Oceanobacillus kimchii]GLO68295.1 hypothetical protein MACH08_40790 [Oceanobacillus kimchii]
MTNNNDLKQTDIFSLFGIEDEYEQRKKRKEEERLKKQSELAKKMKQSNENSSATSAPNKPKVEFEVNSETVIYFYTETIDINDYFSTEELEHGLPKKNKDGEIEYKKIQENDVKKRLNKDYPVMSAGAELVYVKKQNMVSIILKAKKKGNPFYDEKESNTDSFPRSNLKIPFNLLRDFIAIAKMFSDNDQTEVHADIYLNIDTGEFIMDIPKQNAHPYWVEVTEEPYETVEKFSGNRHVKCMEIHSHHVMPPFPSSQDDESERAPIFYAIIGNINEFFPNLTVRTFDIQKGKHIQLNPWSIFESPFSTVSHNYDLSVVEVVQ